MFEDGRMKGIEVPSALAIPETENLVPSQAQPGVTALRVCPTSRYSHQAGCGVVTVSLPTRGEPATELGPRQETRKIVTNLSGHTPTQPDLVRGFLPAFSRLFLVVVDHV